MIVIVIKYIHLYIISSEFLSAEVNSEVEFFDLDMLCFWRVVLVNTDTIKLTFQQNLRTWSTFDMGIQQCCTALALHAGN